MTDRRSRQKEQRAAKKAAEKKKAARKELGRRLVTALGFGAVVVGVLVVGGVFAGDGTLSSTYEKYRSQPTACGAEQPPELEAMQFSEPEEQTDLAGAAAARALIETSCGSIEFDLNLENGQTVGSFIFLARKGFFNGQVFHRILADFAVQGGDQASDGTGGPGYRIPDELPTEDFTYAPGVVAMANRGRGTSGSQFFIVLGDSASTLNNQFNVLGQVVSGQETLEKIAAVDTARRPGSVEDSLPLESVYIETVSIEITGS